MQTIRERMKKDAAQRVTSLLDININMIRMEKLPASLLNFDFGNHSVYFNMYGTDPIRCSVKIDLSYSNNSLEDVAALKKALAKTCGVAFETVRHSWGEDFTHEGILVDDVPEGYEVKVEISNAPKPETCILTKRLEMREVEVFSAVCSDTGKQM